MSATLPAYCAKAGCGAFVGEGIVDQPRRGGTDDGGHSAENPRESESGMQSEEERFLTCAKCHMKTCAFRSCKRLHRDHLGSRAVCPNALEDASLRRIGEEKGWKRCPRCWALTEKSSGCDRIRYVGFCLKHMIRQVCGRQDMTC